MDAVDDADDTVGRECDMSDADEDDHGSTWSEHSDNDKKVDNYLMPN